MGQLFRSDEGLAILYELADWIERDPETMSSTRAIHASMVAS
jgi:hypothetical protein